MQPKQNFDIPVQVREIAEKGVSQAEDAFTQFMAATHKAVEAVETSTSSMHAGAAQLGRQSLGYAEKNVSAALTLARKLASARDMQEIMQLQAEFMQTQLGVFSEQAKSLTETAAKLAQSTAETAMQKK